MQLAHKPFMSFANDLTLYKW